ncbi:hypothetical protein [Vibrio cholerae]|uniref:hypothetical protein n=1 Tax=Vibrio cholerae TaxID=666 RepID=UPI0029C1B887|nr:hypothetical protein [Vibrio cholerae]MDX5049990.1 hypothetical protein [Vibrio cholerae]
MMKITVFEVNKLMLQAAQKMNVEDDKDLHVLFGVGERTYRRWRSNHDKEPDSVSAIPERALVHLQTLATGQCPLKPLDNVDWTTIPSEYITNAQKYSPPPVDVLVSIVGRSGITKLPRKEIGRLIGVNWKKFSDDVSRGEISFGTWASILLLCGVPYQKIFHF